MLISYISKEGNLAEIDCLEIPSYIEKIGNSYFEKRELTKETKKEVIIDESPVNEVTEDMAREYLREKKVKWFGLLKWEKLIERAMKEGFII